MAGFVDAKTSNRPCQPRTVALSTVRVDDILDFSSQLEADSGACDSGNGEYFNDENTFNNLTDRADRLIQVITLLDARIPSKSTITNLVQSANVDYQEAFDFSKAYLSKFPDTVNSQDLQTRLMELNTRLANVVAAEKRLPNDIQQINVAMSRAFAHINALYQISASTTPVLVTIGQYNQNISASFSIVEVPNPVSYSVVQAKEDDTKGPVSPRQQPDALPQLPVQPGSQPSNPFDDSSGGGPRAFSRGLAKRSPGLILARLSPVDAEQGVQADAKKVPPVSDMESASATKIIYNGNFDVHRIYRGNLVAGFFASSLANRPYGLTNNGQATSTANLTFVSVQGRPYRPQLHAFVGIDVYLWERDAFPGQLSKQGFLWMKSAHWGFVNGYLNPGILIGIGVDAVNNYLIGANWETKWGINLGFGLHIGQEAMLQPGIEPGVTQLPSSTTSVPTFNMIRPGFYGNLGFDLSVMRAAFGQVFGGSASVGNK